MAGVQDEFAEQFAGGGVDDADVQVVRPDGETDWRRWAAEYLERVRRILDDEAWSRSFRA